MKTIRLQGDTTTGKPYDKVFEVWFSPVFNRSYEDYVKRGSIPLVVPRKTDPPRLYFFHISSGTINNGQMGKHRRTIAEYCEIIQEAP